MVLRALLVQSSKSRSTSACLYPKAQPNPRDIALTYWPSSTKPSTCTRSCLRCIPTVIGNSFCPYTLTTPSSWSNARSSTRSRTVDGISLARICLRISARVKTRVMRIGATGVRSLVPPSSCSRASTKAIHSVFLCHSSSRSNSRLERLCWYHPANARAVIGWTPGRVSAASRSRLGETEFTESETRMPRLSESVRRNRLRSSRLPNSAGLARLASRAMDSTANCTKTSTAPKIWRRCERQPISSRARGKPSSKGSRQMVSTSS